LIRVSNSYSPSCPFLSINFEERERERERE